ncbi:unnamed protein product [Urochloa decumbens]|uniref:Protein RIK n=1 Tax=Urochloa decumbens TaxID=240449 RepID=A0ABC8XPB5_9POAL
MTEDRAHKVTDEPAAATRQRPERKKRKWDQPAEDLVSAAAAAAAVSGMPVINIGAFSGNASAALQKLSQAKIPDEVIAREIVINDADPSVRYKLTKRQTQEEIQRCTSTVIITRGKYHPPNGQPDGDKPLYLHISAGSQLKDTAERIKAVDRAASMIEEILKQGTISESTSAPFSSSNGQAVHSFSASIFLGFDADPSLNIAARIRGPNDQYINHIMKETGVTVVIRGKDSDNLGSCLGEASQQPLHIYLTSMHLKSLEAAKVLAENLLDTIAAEFGASRISSSKVYGAVPPPQQLLAGLDTSGARSDVHSTLGPNVLPGASQSFASTGVIAPVVAPAVTLQSGALAYSGIPPPSNMTCPIPPLNGGTFYSGYGDIYPQATPLQQVALTLKHASSSTTQVVPVTNTLTSTAIKSNSSSDVETDKRSRRKFQELPVSRGPTTEENSQQGSTFVRTGLYSLGDISDSSIAPPKKAQPGSNVMFPPDQADMSSHLSISNMVPLPPPKSMLPPPPKNMPPPPPKFPANEILPRNKSETFASKELMAPTRGTSILPSQLPPKDLEETTKGTPVSDTLLKLMDYGDDDDDDNIDVPDNIPKGNPTPSEQKPFWAVQN